MYNTNSHPYSSNRTFDIDMKESNFYLGHGGKYTRKAALKDFEAQMGKIYYLVVRDSFCFLQS